MGSKNLSQLATTKAVFLLAAFASVPVSVICQTNFGFNRNGQNFQQQQEFVFSDTAQPQEQPQQQQLLHPVQTFHQFQAVPTSQQQFHPEQPPSQQSQNFGRPANELAPPQARFQQREGRTEGGQGHERIMSDTCLACLCQASTECKMSTRCISNDQYCGAFLISKPYWVDARKPTLTGDNPDRPEAFIDCAVDPICSAQTVRNYMQRFERDCNGDGAIDCDDLARIHLMSAFDCSNPKVSTTGFYQKFRTCWDRVLQLSQK